MSLRVLVVGQGYVGMPVAIAAAKCSFLVTGYDTDLERIRKIANGNSPVEDVSDIQLQEALSSGKYSAVSEIIEDLKFDIFLICVPTPLSTSHLPDLTHLNSAVAIVGRLLKKGNLVLVESTIAPGTTRNHILPILASGSGLKEKEFLVAYSPERIDPLNIKWSLKNTPKLIAGLSLQAAEKAQEFYSKFIDHVEICPSLEVAETAKILENSFRFINISFINEIAMFCQKIGIDINDVVKAAATKPYGFMPFYPSVGVGGHCIPVDPLYLASAAKEAGAPTRFIDLADQINLEMPSYFVARADEILGGLKGKKILVIGVAYKPNVADVRETPVAVLITGLEKSGASVAWHDDLVKTWNNQSSAPITDKYDLAIIATLHDYIQLSNLGNTPILNTRGSK